MVEEVRILPPLVNSDHNAISFHMKIEATVSTAPDNESQDFNGADWGKIRRGLSVVKWNDLLTGDVQQNIDTFTQVLQDKCQSIPRRRKRRRMRCMWMTRKAKKAIRYKAKTWRKYRSTGAAVDHDRYMAALSTATKVVKTAKREFEIKLAKNIKTDSDLFLLCKIKATVKRNNRPTGKQQGGAVVDPKEQANILNSFFSSVYTDEDNTSIPDIE